MLANEVERLRQIPIFASIPPAKLKLLAFACERMIYRPGQILCRQGEPGDAAFVILSGTADIIAPSSGGEVVVAQVEENAIVGEIAVLCGAPRTATVRAASPVEVLRIDKEQFLTLVHDFPEVAAEVMRLLASRLSDTTAELAEARIMASLPPTSP